MAQKYITALCQSFVKVKGDLSPGSIVEVDQHIPAKNHIKTAHFFHSGGIHQI
jgi:hypothetical protein